MSRSPLTLFLAAFLLASLSISAQENTTEAAAQAETSPEEAPDPRIPRFPVRTLDGEDTVLVPGQGRILVLNWWATWCGPCRVEIPELNMLEAKWGDHPEVEMVAVAWDEVGATKGFLDRNEFNFDHLISTAETKEMLGGTLPRNVVFDRDGRLLLNVSGYRRTTVYKIADILRDRAPLDQIPETRTSGRAGAEEPADTAHP